jgi:hypothetical protein
VLGGTSYGVSSIPIGIPYLTVYHQLRRTNYCLTDPPVVTEEKWIEANDKLVQKMGVEPYLATLQNVLRAGGK